VAELTPKERLQPSLLDRLTDEEPSERDESRERRVLSWQRLREVVRRDLSWLFNTVNLESTQSLADYPEAARSVINYGLPDLTGRTLASVETDQLERLLRQAIRDFEPRILPSSLRVRLLLDPTAMSHNALLFDIEGELWAQPVPLQLYLRTEVDLELGQARVNEAAGSARR
jgi:type VI secretion system protein ImpF